MTCLLHIFQSINYDFIRLKTKKLADASAGFSLGLISPWSQTYRYRYMAPSDVDNFDFSILRRSFPQERHSAHYLTEGRKHTPGYNLTCPRNAFRCVPAEVKQKSRALSPAYILLFQIRVCESFMAARAFLRQPSSRILPCPEFPEQAEPCFSGFLSPMYRNRVFSFPSSPYSHL